MTKPLHNKILIVDDNPRNIQIVGNILLKKEAQIAYATDAAKALEMVKQTHYDLFLLDIMMPGMDGYELCEILRQNEQLKNVPIIFLTAKTDTNSIIKGFELGANDYVTKPFNSAELIARVETHLDLYNKTSQLSTLNAELEQKVIERTQQLAFANQQLLNLEKAKSEFLALMSHELRNPLNGVIGLTTLLAQTNLTTEQDEYIQTLSRAAARLAGFSELALLITSLRSRNQKIDIYPVLVKITVELAIEEALSKLNEHKILIDLSFENPDLQMWIDADLIRKCLDLLIDNAIYHSPKGGKLSIRVYSESEMYHCISVSDSGAGFDDETLQQLNDFIMHGQLVSKEGAGLSLAAVKLIIEAHGGMIRVANLPDGGANVCLLFRKA
jgi:two-component system sensor histidine kinase/response regulator